MSLLFRYLLALNKYCLIAILIMSNPVLASPVFHVFPYRSFSDAAKIQDIEYVEGRGVWLLDSKGHVSFYDGLHYHKLSAFTSIDTNVSHIAVFEGALWLVSKGQLFRYDVDSNKLVHQKTTGQISNIIVSSEGLWAATSSSLYLIKPGEAEPAYFGTNRYQRLLLLDDTALGAVDNALYMLASGEFQLSLMGEKALSAASDGMTLYLGHENGLSLYRQGKLTERFLDGKPVNHIIASNEGIWAGGEAGLYLGLEKEGAIAFKEISGDNDDAFSFSGRMVTDIEPGQSNDLWVSSDAGLNFRTSIAENIRRFPMFMLSPEPDEEPLTGLEETGDGYLLTTRFKLVSLNADMVPRQVVRSEAAIEGMALLDDTLWLATGSGLKGVNPDTLKTYPDIVPASLNGLAVDRVLKDSHSLWLTAGSRVIRFWPRSRTVVDFGSDWTFSNTNRLTSVIDLEEKGTWLGTTNGLYVYFDGRFERVLAREEIGTVKSMHPGPSGKLWLLTSRGVYTYDEKHAPVLSEIFINASDDTAKCLSVDDTAAYFIASKGIYEYKFSAGVNRFIQGAHHLTQSTQHICRKKKDNMLIAGDYGVFAIPNQTLAALFQAPSANLTPGAVYVNGTPWRLGPSSERPLQLTTKGSVAVEVSRMPFGATTPLVYRLEGNPDPNWYSTNDQQLVFSALDTGKYNLVVKVGDEHSGFDELRLLSFVVVPPWYQRLGFVLFAVILFIVSMALYYRRKNSSIKAQNKQLRETVHRKVTEISLRQESLQRFCEGTRVSECEAFATVTSPELCSEGTDVQCHWQTAVMNEINAHFHDPDYSTSVLAKAMCVSERSLQRRFKLEFGITFKEVLITTRLESAKRMLCQGDRITDVAIACGFNEPSYFTRSFKAKYGMTPSQFRDKCGASEAMGQGR